MGYELWTSRITGYRRKGTRFSEIRKLFDDGITARAIQEPLIACLYDDDALSVGEELRIRDFDIAGIKRDEGSKVVEFVWSADLVTGTCSH